MEGFIRSSLETNMGKIISALVSPALLPMAYGIGVILVFWIILFWMYRRKLFLKI
jgi:predicted acyltransferase